MPGVEELWRVSQRWEKDIAVMLKDSPTTRMVDDGIRCLRDLYANIIFLDFEYALGRDVEGRIWGKHHKIIERYRKHLHQFQESNGKRKPVELRKLQNAFIKFIKQATRFYRMFIQRLVSHFGVHDLGWVVRKFNLSISAPDTPPNFTPEIHTLVIRSCHRTLVFLGDLSRYRETLENPKNWGPATGYYSLAKKLVPSSGTPHNQLAVIAMNEGSNLSATYHLYRALSVAEPFPEAEDNLGLGFRKVLKLHKMGSLGANLVRREEQTVGELVSLFVRLHAKCFSGKEFSEHEALESEMLTQLALDLKERTLSNGMLSKLVIINIAAQFHAAKKCKELGTSNAHTSLLRLNVATFTTLHQVFQPELEHAAGEKADTDAETVSAVGRRMLPSLRLYSVWLRINHQTLTDQLAGTAISVLIKQLWQTYANTLSLLTSAFSNEEFSALDYLLEEDDDAIGFLPFAAVNGGTKINWKDEERGESGHVHPNVEMLARISLLLQDGRELCMQENVPITIVDGTITYQEDGILTSTPSIGMNFNYSAGGGGGVDDRRMSTPDIPHHQQPAFHSNININMNSSNNNKTKHDNNNNNDHNDDDDDDDDVCRPAESVFAQGGTSIVDSAAGSETMTVVMNRMVDSLVGPREDPFSEDDDDGGVGGRRRGDGGGGGSDDDDDEQVLFRGRGKKASPARRKSKPKPKQPKPSLKIAAATPVIIKPTPTTPMMVPVTPLMMNSPRTGPVMTTTTANNTTPKAKGTYTARDLANLVQNFTQSTKSTTISSSVSQQLPTPSQGGGGGPQGPGRSSGSIGWGHIYNPPPPLPLPLATASASASPMADPSSFFYPPSSAEAAAAHAGFVADKPSPLFYSGGSQWASPVRDTRTPPNGQGGGGGGGFTDNYGSPFSPH